MAYATTSANLPDRMMRAARLNTAVYEEVEADLSATNQALLVVVIASLASGIGSALGATMAGSGANPIAGLISGVLSALLGWGVWSFAIYFVGTKIFGGEATYGEVLRTLGFAWSPGVLLILTFIPVLGPILGLVVGIWLLVTGFIGARQALDIGNGKTIGTIIVAFIALMLVLLVVGLIIGLIFGAGMALGGAAR